MFLPREMFASFGSAIGGLAFIWVMLPQWQRYVPPQIRDLLHRCINKLVNLFYPYVLIVFSEFEGERLLRSETYMFIQSYLKEHATSRVRRLKAETVKDSQTPILSMGDNQEVTEMFEGVKVWWASRRVSPRNMTISFHPVTEERRYYRLLFHRRHRELITQSYIKHVLTEGKEIARRNRMQKLYTNDPSKDWTYVAFEHPANFETLAMDPNKKREIINDLKKFREGKEYYAKIGKPWKRGYLLYGPPGTGKSTMIAAMANFLSYDVYDLELTAVKDNTKLKKLLIKTSSKSIIVIEDIDCSLDLTGQRKKREKENNDDDDEENDDPAKKMVKEEEKGRGVTLSGLLNFIDGIWSARGGERIIIFTTNHVEKLDPALIRRGRMDKRIEMSYCCFEAFKVLARNYLDIEDHPLFEMIGQLLDETNMIPADVVEHLMPKSDDEDAETCLRSLIEALEAAKKEAGKKAKDGSRAKAKEGRAKKVNGEKEEAKESGTSAKEVKENGDISGVAAATDLRENGVAVADVEI
ncbi:hypothetical protein BT93_I1013 [Corymbia citriodora subsp. variegata]|nr:hypothetical protein BT93_I1013 [Corymbia citriodora subsp. variegata]